MYSIMNHDRNNNINQNLNKQSSHQQQNTPNLTNFTPSECLLQPSQSLHNPSSPYGPPKVSMKQLYKNQLDEFMQEKQKQKKLQKQMLQKQKQEYREKVRIGQENQKMKDIAYKNYYKMLMESHEHNSETYVSPYELRDKLKESHIQQGIQQEMQKSQNYEYERKMRELQKKNAYKQELSKQIEQRKRFEQAKKTFLQEQNTHYKQYTRTPTEIQAYQRERKKEEMDLYRSDLDRLVQDKLSQSRRQNSAYQQLDPKMKVSDDYHNPLVNPLPYNIQNPYILKQMQKLSTQSIKNDSLFYGNNIQERQYEQQRPRNQSSYFARQANNMFK